jgi:hypothetical protein
MLESLPPDLDATYYRILDEIDSSLIPKASRALAWLAFSSRSLYLEELVDACAIDLHRSPVLSDRLKPYNLFEMLHDLVLIQPPLVSPDGLISPRKHTIVLFHASVGEFLSKIGSPDAHGYSPRMQGFLLEEQRANMLIAKSCLAYLYYYNTLESRHGDFPLLEYAWYHWEKHVDLGKAARPRNVAGAVVRRRALSLYFELGGRKSSPRILPLQPLATGSGPVSKSLKSLLHIRWKGLRARIPSPNSGAESNLADSARTENSAQELTDWLPTRNRSRLKEAINTPFFHPNFELFFSQSPPLHIYHPLDDSRHAVRFLELLPCLDSTTEIRCRLFESSLDENPRYVALSYVWGDTSSREYISVQGKPVEVIPSQAQILRVLRSRGEDSVSAIWLDGLCINQQDFLERSSQVRLMKRLFAQARDIIVGLGEEIETDEQGIRVLAEIASLSRVLHNANDTDKRDPPDSVRDTIDSIETSGGWDAMAAVFRGAWWNRMWTVPEIVLAANGIVLIGSLSFNFNIIEQAIKAEPVVERFLSPLGRTAFSRLKSQPGWLAAKRMMRTRSQWRQNNDLPLPALLWRFRYHRCVDPRDKIYALLGICRWEDAEGVRPNHSLAPSEMYSDISRFIIQAYECLDILSICSSYDGDSYGNPSWVPFLRTPGSRKPLVLGIFDWPLPPVLYTACGHSVASIIGYAHQVSGLVLRGQLFDTVELIESISDVKEDSLDGSTLGNTSLEALCRRISRHQEQFSGTTYSQSQPSAEVRWRTLLADQWPLGQRLGYNTFRGLQVPSSAAEEATLLDQPDVTDDMPFLEGRVVVVTSAGYLGLAPEETQRGDEIAVMAGGAVPYILRRSSTEDAYSLIGEW